MRSGLIFDVLNKVFAKHVDLYLVFVACFKIEMRVSYGHVLQICDLESHERLYSVAAAEK